ncbi:tryptophan synthase subunit alpha [Candidatus Persebacteraceae bacterium Df01]|jgi:tryptophan synthase alpha chain|uniref:Tryptophan synthase alpha chain n=1 Tax=Candidatus Doriopsillibacter californiensis TaxID=2970740 RepID=A0ABT7QLN7_9GAMM|nr:tryptophan synthase subunit alpha [Candidatus Persebacteraceae bacterium Df01]
MSDLITNAFACTDKRACLVAFITAGFPHADSTPAMLSAIAEAGADIIEIGVPFSDPMADGPAIQRSSEVALANGMTLKKTIAATAAFRNTNTTVPLVLMGYANSFLNHPGGAAGLAQAAQQANINGLIVVDLADEDRANWKRHLAPAGVSLVNLVAPTTNESRLQQIANDAEGFLYAISLKGVTGAGNLDVENVAYNLRAVKQIATVPVVAGFGIRTPEHALQLANHADGVVIGSKLVEIAEAAADPPAEVGAFIKQMATTLAH